jgi:hypothetical protein
MIKVKRLDCPVILQIGIDPASDGENETRDAIVFYNDVANHEETYKKMGSKGKRIKESFAVYSEKEVRKQLVKMHHGKCAYCESKITSMYSGDVEHFRPKGGYGFENPITKPGYYWLASDWDNLLLACPFCNQTNTHEISVDGGVIELVQGKLNQFPLLTQTYRLNYTHGALFFNDQDAYKIVYDLEESERLLLKPCTDEVELHFKYLEEGVILPAEELTDFQKNRATTSISVYALQRMGLVQTREEKVIEIKAQIRRVEEAMQNFAFHYDSMEEVRTWFEGILRREMETLNEFKSANKVYAGLARYLIDNYFKNII